MIIPITGIMADINDNYATVNPPIIADIMYILPTPIETSGSGLLSYMCVVGFLVCRRVKLIIRLVQVPVIYVVEL